jgi:3-keto-5-aminohexanoate cleavage enzyme
VTKAMNPNLPEQPEEIIASAYECFNEGAAIVHIHGRDRNGENTSDPTVFSEIQAGIPSRCDLITQFSTGGGPNLTQEQRLAFLEAAPEMASLNMGSLMRVSGNYAGQAFANLPAEIDRFVGMIRNAKIKPEMEVYNLAMLRDVERVI